MGAFNGAGVVATRSAAVRAPAAQMAFIDSLEGAGEETGGEIWDPLGISNAVSDEAMMWFRAAELKHGRAAMLGSVGYLVGAAGITFPGEIAKGVSFASVNSDGVYNAWAKVPEEGKLQILCLLLALETANESKKPHYMRGGVPGRWHQRPVGAQDQVLGPAQLHGRALGGAEGPQEEGRAEERPPGDDRHGLVPHRPQPARLRPRPH